MRIAGVGGWVRVGYQTAATVGAWTLTRLRSQPEQAYEATASLTSMDAFWSQQRPCTLELMVGSRAWVWANIEPLWTAQSLTVTLTGGPVIH